MKLDTRITMLIAGILVTIPLIYVIPAPISVSPWVTDAYNTINATPNGSNVWWQMGWDGGGDQQAEFIDLWKYLLFTKQDKIMFNAEAAEQIPLSLQLWVTQILGTSPDQWSGYGTQLVNLGLIESPGYDYIFVNDIRSLVKVDAYGNSLDDFAKLPMMQNIHSLHDFALFLGDRDAPALHDMVPTMKIVAWSATGHWFSTVDPLWRAGLVAGGLNGLRGAAEWEKISNQPGGASKLIVGQLALGAWVFIICIAGAIYHFMPKSRKQEELKVNVK